MLPAPNLDGPRARACSGRMRAGVVVVCAVLACSSERAGGGGAGASEGAGARDGAAGGAGAAGACSPFAMSQSADCRACIVAVCDAPATACFGPAWQSGEARGAPCEQFVGCTCACGQGDMACQSACLLTAPSACSACLVETSRCITSGCSAACNASPPMGCSSGGGGTSGGPIDGGAVPGRSVTCTRTGATTWHCTCYGAGAPTMCDTTSADPCGPSSCCPP